MIIWDFLQRIILNYLDLPKGHFFYIIYIIHILRYCRWGCGDHFSLDLGKKYAGNVTDAQSPNRKPFLENQCAVNKMWKVNMWILHNLFCNCGPSFQQQRKFIWKDLSEKKLKTTSANWLNSKLIPRGKKAYFPYNSHRMSSLLNKRKQNWTFITMPARYRI